MNLYNPVDWSRVGGRWYLFYSEIEELFAWMTSDTESDSDNLYAVRIKGVVSSNGEPDQVRIQHFHVAAAEILQEPRSLNELRSQTLWIGLEHQSPSKNIARCANSNNFELWLTINGLIQIRYSDWIADGSGHRLRTKMGMMCVDRIRNNIDLSKVHTHESGSLYRRLKRIIRERMRFATIPAFKDGSLGIEDSTYVLMSEGAAIAHSRGIPFDVIPGRPLPIR